MTHFSACRPRYGQYQVRPDVLARHVMGPADLERGNRNFVGGDDGEGSFRLRMTSTSPGTGR
jgi:hypothetical protein